jgi:hypothetical protein
MEPVAIVQNSGSEGAQITSHCQWGLLYIAIRKIEIRGGGDKWNNFQHQPKSDIRHLYVLEAAAERGATGSVRCGVLHPRESFVERDYPIW